MNNLQKCFFQISPTSNDYCWGGSFLWLSLSDSTTGLDFEKLKRLETAKSTRNYWDLYVRMTAIRAREPPREHRWV
jgi:hypothetical protein